MYPATQVPARSRRAKDVGFALGIAVLFAAAAMFALQHEVMAAQGIPIQGKGREAYRS